MNHYDIDSGFFDTGPWLAARRDAVPSLSFSRLTSTDPAAMAGWQNAVKARLIERVGILPESRCELDPRALDDIEVVNGEYRREAVSFQSREGLRVFAFFLTPLEANGPLPAVMCYSGHGDGVNPVIGLDTSGRPLSELDYQNAFAVQAVRRGYAVLAIEHLGFGRRRLGNDCSILSGAALMLGETMTGWRVYDAMRALDYACTRPEVDPARIATMGISGGGLVSMFHAALDERVKAAVVSGYYNEFTACVMSIPHCIDNFLPGLRLDMEMSDIAGIIAPRPLWCENGSEDDIFPIAAFHRAIARGQQIYAALGEPDRLHGHEFPGSHKFDGVGCWEFLERYL